MADEKKILLPRGQEIKLSERMDQCTNSLVTSAKPNKVLDSIAKRLNGWMGPQVPLQVFAPTGTPARQLDYPIAYNINIAPRSGMQITFEMMTALAQWDLLRIIMERRKNQIITQAWDIQSLDEDEKKSQDDKSIADIKTKLRMPDNEHDWPSWLRAVLDQFYVYDATTIEPVYKGDGSVHGFYGINGATIQLKIDEQGRTPKPPEVAYQQIIKGQGSVDFTTDDLIYKPWNHRFSSLFGYSVVEQIIMTINIGLRRERQQLYAFTAGTIPEALMETPQGWTGTQIQEYQEYFDSYYMGNLERRAGLVFVPYGSKPMEVKGDALKQEFDEWLIRIACWAMGVSPSGFVKDTNRATAETARTQALQEGAASDMVFVKSLMDMMLIKCFKRPDLEFTWSDDDQQDPVEKMTVETGYVKVGIKSVDEIRVEHGDDPIGMTNAIFQNSGPPIFIKDLLSGAVPIPGTQPKPAEGGDDDPETDQDPDGDGSKAAKAARRLKKKFFPVLPLIGSTALNARFKNAVNKTFRKNFDKAVAPVLAHVEGKLGQAGKADDENDKAAKQAADLADLSFFDDIPDLVIPIIERAAISSARQAFVQVGGQTTADLLNQMDDDAYAWAEEHAAEMVGKKFVDGELVDNPDAEYSISDSTRNMIEGKVKQALEEGWSRDRLSAEIKQIGFSGQRSSLIAQTELKMTHSAANIAGWRASGIVTGKKSLLSADHKETDECDDNAAAGVIPLEEDFPSGDDADPFHPGCNCATIAVIEKGGPASEADDEDDE